MIRGPNPTIEYDDSKFIFIRCLAEYGSIPKDTNVDRDGCHAARVLLCPEKRVKYGPNHLNWFDSNGPIGFISDSYGDQFVYPCKMFAIEYKSQIPEIGDFDLEVCKFYNINDIPEHFKKGYDYGYRRIFYFSNITDKTATLITRERYIKRKDLFPYLDPKYIDGDLYHGQYFPTVKDAFHAMFVIKDNRAIPRDWIPYKSIIDKTNRFQLDIDTLLEQQQQQQQQQQHRNSELSQLTDSIHNINTISIANQDKLTLVENVLGSIESTTQEKLTFLEEMVQYRLNCIDTIVECKLREAKQRIEDRIVLSEGNMEQKCTFVVTTAQSVNQETNSKLSLVNQDIQTLADTVATQVAQSTTYCSNMRIQLLETEILYLKKQIHARDNLTIVTFMILTMLYIYSTVL